MGALNFRSRLAPYIIGLIEQKRALGYKYTAQVKILQKFDMLCAERFSEDSTVTKAMLDVWAVKGPEEAPGTLRHRVTVIAHLAQHIASLGFYAYIYPTNELPKEPKYNPYIFSGDELTRFFRQVDCCHFSSEVPNRHMESNEDEFKDISEQIEQLNRRIAAIQDSLAYSLCSTLSLCRKPSFPWYSAFNTLTSFRSVLETYDCSALPLKKKSRYYGLG